nr:Hsp20/alpha crystallin family protein [Armatimonas sp.]
MNIAYNKTTHTLDKQFPFDPLTELIRALAPVASTCPPAAWVPAVDVLETPEALTLHVELPGVKPEEIEIELTGDTLTLRGERRSGKFVRGFTLATPIQAEKVSAAYRDGVLEITLPKSEESKPHKIPVTVEA